MQETEPTPKSLLEASALRPSGNGEFLVDENDSNIQENNDHDYRQKRLKLAIVICFLLFLIQLTGGWLSSSLALMADAYHMLSDVIGYTISLLSIALSTSASTRQLPFGRKRLEVLGALASIALLWALSFVLFIEATNRLYNPKVIDGKTMLIMAIGGVVVNGLLIGIFGHEIDHDQIYRDIEGVPLALNGNFQEVQLVAESDGNSQERIFSHHTKSDINMRVRMV
jgi:zinc transporter 2